jgi:hypothetical protein
MRRSLHPAAFFVLPLLVAGSFLGFPTTASAMTLPHDAGHVRGLVVVACTNNVGSLLPRTIRLAPEPGLPSVLTRSCA